MQNRKRLLRETCDGDRFLCWSGFLRLQYGQRRGAYGRVLLASVLIVALVSALLTSRADAELNKILTSSATADSCIDLRCNRYGQTLRLDLTEMLDGTVRMPHCRSVCNPY